MNEQITFPRVIEINGPATGSNFSMQTTEQELKKWKPVSVSFTLQTSSTAATRRAKLTLQDPTVTAQFSISTIEQTASTTKTYCFSQTTENERTSTSSNFVNVPLGLNDYFSSEYYLQSEIENLQADDKITNITILIIEILEI